MRTFMYVSTCPETGRVFLCLEGVEDNVAEVFEHGGRSAQENAERIAEACNTPKEGT